MHPFLETIDAPGASCALLERRLDEGIPFQWHHHPEFELTLTCNSRGYRHIGDSIESYGDRDLVLVAPNVPHSWCSHALVGNKGIHHAVVVWFAPHWIEQVALTMPELQALSRLLAVHQGVCFSTRTVLAVQQQILELPAQPPPQRLIQLLQILLVLSTDPHASELTTGAHPHLHPHTIDSRILRVAEHLQAHFNHPVSVPTLAHMVHLSASALSRAFFRNMRMTITHYVMRLRIGKACSLLIMTDTPISRIASDVGYTNLSLFNRQFQHLKGQSPRAFKNRYRQLQGR